jgi:hypothetical protein
MIVDELHISNDTVWKTVTEDLEKRKLCGRFVLHELTAEQEEEDQVAACQDLIKMADSDPDSFEKIVTSDESWCFVYDPSTK